MLTPLMVTALPVPAFWSAKATLARLKSKKASEGRLPRPVILLMEVAAVPS